MWTLSTGYFSYLNISLKKDSMSLPHGDKERILINLDILPVLEH